jgi:hypothetical protein
MGRRHDLRGVLAAHRQARTAEAERPVTRPERCLLLDYLRPAIVRVTDLIPKVLDIGLFHGRELVPWVGAAR